MTEKASKETKTEQRVAQPAEEKKTAPEETKGAKESSTTVLGFLSNSPNPFRSLRTTDINKNLATKFPMGIIAISMGIHIWVHRLE